MRTHVKKLVAVMMVLLVGLGVWTMLAPAPVEAKPPGGGGPCGDCPCQDEIVLPNGDVCWLEGCHLLDRKNCYWDCHYVCPFPG